MNFSRTITGLILSIFMLMPTVAQPNPWARKGFHVGCTAAGAFLPTLYLVMRGQLRPYSTDSEGLPDADLETQNFCRRELEKVGVNSSMVEVKYDKTTPAAATDGQKILYLNPNFKMNAGAIQHEGIHIRNNDVESIANVSAGICAGLTFHTLRKLKKELPSVPGRPLYRSLLKLPGGLAKGAGGIACLFTYIRHTEQRADDGIENDIKTLQEQKSYFERYHNGLMESHASLYETASKNGFLEKHPHLLNFYIKYPKVYTLSPAHPPTPKRIEKLGARIAKLEQEQNKN